MSIQDIYEAAGLTQQEIEAIDRCIDGDYTDSDVELAAFAKLERYFSETEQMPYAIATQSVWHPDNTATPDEWIVEHLQMCNTAPAVV
jgi:hypothetical protein